MLPRIQQPKVDLETFSPSFEARKAFSKDYSTLQPSPARLRPKNRSVSSNEIVAQHSALLRERIGLHPILSSKIDFFNADNQRKLDVSRNKIMSDMGVGKDANALLASGGTPKKAAVAPQAPKELGAQLHILLQKYLSKKQQNLERQKNYVVLGHRRDWEHWE